ncbi:RNA polymerase II elongation factor ELL-like [Boleophthalmus pectinirostris]|uniref:RNA polymerase II elongation factor ELL-like n=1 Tax=Boleophthalmus pectinirostris TaxID=150288 RepID=UPI000A1C681A|nr:RNA polymerase II elongation factor ELL-like [Boleophthalmus pectinirostris]
MSALKENHSYGLSSAKPAENVSVFHVKLTDSAARAIGGFQSAKGWTSSPTICFGDNKGKISIPCSDNQDKVRVFTFTLNNVSSHNPHGRFECVQQTNVRAAEELSCLGVIQKKMTVNATEDSYDKAIQSMAQAEEETRSRGAIVIKHGGRFQGRKVTVRSPAAANSNQTKPKPQSHSLLSSMKKGVSRSKVTKATAALGQHNSGTEEVQRRPLRERVTHLLALKPYRKPELLLRLQRDGLRPEDKGQLENVLQEVGQQSSKDNAFVLKDSLFKELQKDWPGYTAGDQQLLKRILVRRLFQPQQNLLSVPEAQVSPLRDTPNSSPAHRPKHSLYDDYTDPLLSKRLRISHLSAKTDTSRPRRTDPAQPRPDPSRLTENKNRLDPKKLFESLSEMDKRLEPGKGEKEEEEKEERTEVAENHHSNIDHPPSPLVVPDLPRPKVARRKSKHKHKEKEKDKSKERKTKVEDDANQISQDYTDSCEKLLDSNILQAYDTMDYLSKYTSIRSSQQRQSYKLDFNREYSEYRDLHARIDSVTRQFMELDSQLKQLQHDSQKYKTVHNQIVQEYRKIKKSNPNYSQDKIRCEYLHSKLAHIKKLISEYDQRQMRGESPGPR